MTQWHCGVTSQCLVTPAITYSFTETHTIAGVIKCEWYLFCLNKSELPSHVQSLLPNIYKATYVENQALRIQELTEEFRCICTSQFKPNLYIADEILYVEMQTYNKLISTVHYADILEESRIQRRQCIQLFKDMLPSQLSSMVVDDCSIHNIMLDHGNPILVDPVFAS